MRDLPKSLGSGAEPLEIYTETLRGDIAYMEVGGKSAILFDKREEHHNSLSGAQSRECALCVGAYLHGLASWGRTKPQNAKSVVGNTNE